jgi:SpoVK/Ycf46/Vps4 family AAA+-type ATPase
MRWVFKRARMTTPCLLVFVDIDSMIDDENRSFFLNELDGFETNTGVVIIATTNHPTRLDPAILNRPSRFDRKYYFHLPAAAERRAYVLKWNEELQFALRFSETVVTEVVMETENFSFAYMKELFLSAMMHWMAKNGEVPMGKVILFQAAQLRKQMEESVS